MRKYALLTNLNFNKMNFSKKNHEHKIINIKNVSKKIILGIVFVFASFTMVNAENESLNENSIYGEILQEINYYDHMSIQNKDFYTSNLVLNFSNIDILDNDIVESCLAQAYRMADKIEEVSEQDWSSEEWGRVFRNLFDLCNDFTEF